MMIAGELCAGLAEISRKELTTLMVRSSTRSGSTFRFTTYVEDDRFLTIVCTDGFFKLTKGKSITSLINPSKYIAMRVGSTRSCTT